MLSVGMMSVVMMSVVMLSVVAPFERDGLLGMVTVANVINIIVALSGFTKDLRNPVQYDNSI